MDFKKILSSRNYWAAAIVLIIIVYAIAGRKSAPNIEVVKAERRTITQEVSATGNVKPIKDVDLAFEVGGKISSVNTDVGNYIAAGQIIAALDSSELNAQLNKAQADLASQKAAFDKANIDLSNYYGDVIDTVNSAYTSANDAVRVKIDSLFTDDEINPKLTFESTDSQERITSESQRAAVTITLNSWISEINQTNGLSSQGSLDKLLSDSKTNLKSIYDFLNLLMDTTINSLSLSSSTLNTYKTNINDARGEIDSAMSGVTTLMQNISSQKATVASKQADIKSYEASVDNINAQISKTVLRSPIAGTVTKQDAKVGEIAVANTVVASVISSGDYEIDSYIPEVDIARVKVGNQAKVTLDAYGNDVVFDAAVTSIDPGETILEGVATYLTKLHFQKADARIKPGMTANIDIISATHENVLSLPQRAVQKREGKEFVLIYKNDMKDASSAEEKEITTGIRGYDGYIEVVSGLSEGEEIIIPKSGV